MVQINGKKIPSLKEIRKFAKNMQNSGLDLYVCSDENEVYIEASGNYYEKRMSGILVQNMTLKNLIQEIREVVIREAEAEED